MLARDRHLFSPGPKRILAVDGGGVRGAIAIGTLERVEAVLAERHGRKVPLSDYFDLIGGTSTGAIIATGLALGFGVAEIRDFYTRLGPKVFRRSSWRIVGLQSKFDARKLLGELQAIIGDRRLDSADLKTGLAIVTKRVDTGSPWIVSNNPRARYWETPGDRSYIGNRNYSLANLVRASAAAPHFFDPELIPISEGEPPGLFVDGGVTPHNNPALHLLLMAVLEGYGLKWQTGADKLLLVSAGTGSYRRTLSYESSQKLPAIALAVNALTGLMADTQHLTLTLLSWLAGQKTAWPLNSEIGDLSRDAPAGGTPLLSFRRFDVVLEAGWLNEMLGLSLSAAEVERLRVLDDAATIPRAYELARAVAEKTIRSEDFPTGFDLTEDQIAGGG
jgi:hypothetical protein